MVVKPKTLRTAKNTPKMADFNLLFRDFFAIIINNQRENARIYSFIIAHISVIVKGFIGVFWQENESMIL